MRDHAPFIEKAFERFSSGDYLSTASILYPRIEAIIGTYHSIAAPSKAVTQSELSKTASGHYSNIREESLLLPRRFERYLQEVYFAKFEPDVLTESVSRNSISHGVVVAQQMDKKSRNYRLFYLAAAFVYRERHFSYRVTKPEQRRLRPGKTRRAL